MDRTKGALTERPNEPGCRNQYPQWVQMLMEAAEDMQYGEIRVIFVGGHPDRYEKEISQKLPRAAA